MKRTFKITLEDPSFFAKNYLAVEKNYSAYGTQAGQFFCYNNNVYKYIGQSEKV